MDGQLNMGGHVVTVTVPKPATIVLQPSAITVRTVSGVNPPDTFFTIRNGGDGSLNWTVSSSVAWLSLNPPSGTTATETDTVKARFAAGALETGTYVASIIVADPSAGNTPQQLSLNLRVGWRFTASNALEVFDASPAIAGDSTIYVA